MSSLQIDWASKIITVPTTYMTLVDSGPPTIRELDIDVFRKDLNADQASEEGMPFDTTHDHTPPKTLGGVTFARVVEFINNYQVKFQDAQYTVNVIGGNSNISDVKVQNQVSVNTANSAGLVQVAGSDVNVASIAGSSTAATRLGTIKDTLIIGTVDDTNFTSTVTEFESSDVTDSVTNLYKSSVVVFTSGTLKGLRTDVTAYALSTGYGHFTVSTMPQAPTNGDSFVIV